MQPSRDFILGQLEESRAMVRELKADNNHLIAEVRDLGETVSQQSNDLDILEWLHAEQKWQYDQSLGDSWINPFGYPAISYDDKTNFWIGHFPKGGPVELYADHTILRENWMRGVLAQVLYCEYDRENTWIKSNQSSGKFNKKKAKGGKFD